MIFLQEKRDGGTISFYDIHFKDYLFNLPFFDLNIFLQKAIVIIAAKIIAVVIEALSMIKFILN